LTPLKVDGYPADMLNVSTHRMQREWSIAELAEKSGVSIPTIERIERDERRAQSSYDPRISRVVSIADALGVCVDALIRERAHASNLPDADGSTPHGPSENTPARGATSPTQSPRADRNGA